MIGNALIGRWLAIGLACLPLLAVGAPVLTGAASAQPSNHAVTQEMVASWMETHSNWGRWGTGDERGTLNLLTPARVKAASALVQKGLSLSLSHQYMEDGSADNTQPFARQVLPINPASAFVSDRYSVSYHGWAHTHMDATCHNSSNGKLYNGYARETVGQQEGCTKDSITVAKNGIIGRAVLVDIPRLKGLPYLEPSTPIYVEDLEAWLKTANVKLRPGDILLLRTGRWARRAEKGAWSVSQQSAGLHASVIPWLRANDISVIGSDAVTDVMPSGVPGYVQPLHEFILVRLGTPLFDHLDLEDAAVEASRLRRWVFMLAAAPLNVGNGTGSPLNPIAVF